MPGSYPDPRSYANEALQALEEAYKVNHDTHTGNLILKAIEAINNLTQVAKNSGNSGSEEYDPYEINVNNSAV
jgi:hypothetical protein